MYKYDVLIGDIPAAVSSAVTNDYAGYRIDEAEKVYKGNITGYFLDLEKNRTEVHAFYQEDGTFLATQLWEDSGLKPANNADTETPPVSGTLTDEETDALIATYYAGNDTDVLTANVPAAIRTSFTTLFPTAREIDWDLSNEVYKVDFEINNVDYDAWYNSVGTLLTYKFDITRSSLPQAVQTAIANRFSGYTIDDVDKVMKSHSIGYFVELERGNVEENAYFSEDGSYLSNSFYRKSTTSVDTPTDPTIPPGSQPEIPLDVTYTDAQIDAMLQAYSLSRESDLLSTQVPSDITTSFTALFSGAYDIEWERVLGVYNGIDVYNADFEIAGADCEAWFDGSGVLLMYTREIRYSTATSAVQSALLAQYADYMVDGCKSFQKGSVKGYLIELEHKRTEAELIVLYAEDGTFISQQRD
jgi:hypothetical protein